jgi:hypothetical protein
MSVVDKTSFSETFSASIIRGMILLIMEEEMVSKAMGFCPQLTWLVAREYFDREILNLKFEKNACVYSGTDYTFRVLFRRASASKG